jgi:hypothetical protein
LGYDNLQLLCTPIQMLRRAISTILVLALIGYGTTWAFAGHALDAVADTGAGAHAHAQSEFDGDCDGSKCDHCCHASAHMLGLSSPPPNLILLQPNCFNLGVDHALAALASSPPQKPPRS